MIKRLFLVFSIFFVFSACASSPATSEKPETVEPLSGVDAYREMSGKFFYFDEQDFTAVTCSIEVPKLTEVLEKTRAQLSVSRYTATLVENMSDFSITYSPAQGISFTSPKIELLMSSVEGIKQPEQVTEWAKQFEEGFAIQIIAIQNQLRGLVDLMTTPELKDFSDVIVMRENGRTVFTYFREGIQVVETFSGNLREMRSQGSNVQLTMKAGYQSIAGGRLAMSTAHIEAKQPVGGVSSDLEIELQEVGDIRFLKRLGVNVFTYGQAINDHAVFDILLRDCRVH